MIKQFDTVQYLDEAELYTVIWILGKIALIENDYGITYTSVNCLTLVKK